MNEYLETNGNEGDFRNLIDSTNNEGDLTRAVKDGINKIFSEQRVAWMQILLDSPPSSAQLTHKIIYFYPNLQYGIIASIENNVQENDDAETKDAPNSIDFEDAIKIVTTELIDSDVRITYKAHYNLDG